MSAAPRRHAQQHHTTVAATLLLLLLATTASQSPDEYGTRRGGRGGGGVHNHTVALLSSHDPAELYNAVDAALAVAVRGVVSVAVLTGNEACIWDNFVSYYGALTKPPPLVVLALDARAHAMCSTAASEAPIPLRLRCVPPHGKAASREYHEIIWLKPALVRMALSRGATVLLTDIDVVYLRNPTSFLAVDDSEFLMEAVSRI